MKNLFYKYSLPSIVIFLFVFLIACENNIEDFEILPGTDNRMIFVAGNTFEMGNQFDSDNADELPVHSVTLSDFYISIYEVSVKEYLFFCEEAGYKKPPMPEWGFISNHPIVNVSWIDAVEYCKWLSVKTGKEYRLPTEAEWEYIARNGGNKIKFTRTFSVTPTIENFGNYETWIKDTLQSGTTPVGIYEPSPLGIYDLVGNVHEWVSDWYKEDYYSFSHKTNPQGPDSGKFKVERGGSWRSPYEISRASNRNYAPANFKIHNIGFRIALSSNNMNERSHNNN